MAETILAKIFTGLGFSALLLGIIANMDNIVSLLLALIGGVFGIIRCLDAWEDYREKKKKNKKNERDQIHNPPLHSDPTDRNR